MKILHIWDYFQPEFKYHIHYISEVFTKQNHAVTFVSSDKITPMWESFLVNKSPQAGVSSYYDCKVIRIKCTAFKHKPIPTDIIAYQKALRNEQPDILHIFGLTTPMSLMALFLVKLGLVGKNIIVVANDHSNPKSKYTHLSWVAARIVALRRFIFRTILINTVKRIFVPNTESYNFVKTEYNLPDDRIKIIPLGYDTEHYYWQPARKNKETKLILGFAGKIAPAKQIERLIAAIEKSEYCGAVKLLVAGSPVGHDAYFDTLSENLKNANFEVEILPFLGVQDLADFYNRIDVAVYPGSISITTQEATGCGTPVILYESISGLADRVENGRGHLFKTDAELEQLISHFYQQKQSNSINNAAIEAASKKFSWQILAQDYLTEYEFLRKKNR